MDYIWSNSNISHFVFLFNENTWPLLSELESWLPMWFSKLHLKIVYRHSLEKLFICLRNCVLRPFPSYAGAFDYLSP